MKKGLSRIAIASAVLLAFTVARPGTASAVFLLDFEGIADMTPAAGFGAITFQSFNGFTSIIGDSQTNLYNTFSDDLGIGWGSQAFHHMGFGWLWAGPSASAAGVIVDYVNNDGTFLTTGYASSSNFTMDLFHTDGTMKQTVGAANVSAPMNFITVTADAGKFIDYVVLHDSGNQWLIDNMSGDASGVSGVIPEPSTLILLGAGGLLMGALRRKRRSV